MSFKKQFEGYIDDVNKYLEERMKNGTAVFDAMKYSLFSGGKRIRPVLTLAVCEALGGNYESALCFGSALEMIHTYSLIHDDLPCMDDDDIRRGKPTNHKVFGESTAVLAGDALLNYAAETVLQSRFESSLKVEALKIIYNNSGAFGMIDGQMLDMEAETKPFDETKLLELHNKKTGALMNAAVSLGAISANRDKEILHNYSSSLGLAFQIRDDILDVEGDESIFGKPINSDEKNHKTTFVSLYGIDKAKKILKNETEKAIDSLEFLGDKKEFLKDMALYLLERES